MSASEGQGAETRAEAEVAAGLAEVRGRIDAAARAAGRDPAAVTLVAVAKSQPPERVEAALGAGQRVFGENYVQEAQGRWPALRERHPEASSCTSSGACRATRRRTRWRCST
jgi:uncharacterized pyridoxal phosphate-containing UPF0001 family protein